jgi:diamine N-acetyltransferase
MGSNKVTLQEITEDTLGPILSLKVQKGQEKFVAPNAVSIAQAYFNKNAWFRAIYAGDEPVGFVMLELDAKIPRYGLWRLMIAEGHQARGYGREALKLVFDFVKTLPGASKLYTSCVPGKGGPRGFYEKLGFTATGEMDDKEEVLVLSLD